MLDGTHPRPIAVGNRRSQESVGNRIDAACDALPIQIGTHELQAAVRIGRKQLQFDRPAAVQGHAAHPAAGACQGALAARGRHPDP